MSFRAYFLFLYTLSGAAALLYEVAWTRLLALHLGHTVAAVSTVLAAFMGGLAGGAALAGRRAPRLTPAAALRACALLELAVALAALAVPFVLAAARPLLMTAYADGDGGAWFGLTRVAVALGALAVPTIAMGATYPMAVRALAAEHADKRRSAAEHADKRGVERDDTDAERGAAGAAYAANTIGAAAGAALAGFVLLPSLGLGWTTVVGVAINVLVAAGFFVIGVTGAMGATSATGAKGALGATGVKGATGATAGARRTSTRHITSTDSTFSTRSTVSTSNSLVLLAIFLSGFLALSYEVVWTRVLALIVGPISYAFSGMLVTFIAGLAIGATLAARAAPRLTRPADALAATFLVGAAGATAALAVAGRGPLIVGRWVARPDASFGWLIAAELAVVGLVLLPMTLAFGAAFPFALRAARGARDAASSAAGVYVANTVGAIAGSLAAGWILIPFAGLRGTIVSLAIAGVADDAAAATTSGALRQRAAAIAGGGMIVIVTALALPRWDPEVLSGGAYKYAPYMRGGDLESGLSAGELLYYGEGAAGTVTVRRTAASIALAIDGKVDASNDADMLTQRLLAHLPLVLHPAPRDVAIVGLGSGVTAGAALAHPIARADVLEISREVVEASAFFAGENHDALGDGRLRLIVGDGRSHLVLGSQTYDVIISEPSNPWMAGVAGLFTREFFASALARLAPRGLFCQWAHTYDISSEDLRSIVATFASVFPGGTMWLVGEGDLLLVGGPSGVEPDPGRIAAAMALPGVAGDLAGVGVRSPFGLLSLFAGGGQDLRAFAAGALAQSDDRLALEFSAPRAIFGRSSGENARDIRARATRAPRPGAVARAFERATAADWRDRGLMLLAADAHGPAFDDLARAARLDPRDRSTLEALTRAGSAAERIGEAERLLQELARDPANVPARLELSRVTAARGDFALARRLAVEAGRAAPDDVSVIEQLASVLADEQDAQALAAAVAGLERAAPGSAGTLYYAASLEYLRGNAPRAAQLAERAAAMRPQDSRAHNLAGAAYGALGEPDRARQAFRAALRARPDDPVAYVNLGTLELQSANAAAAEEYFADALTLDPASPAAREGLARALEILGDGRRAAAVRKGT